MSDRKEFEAIKEHHEQLVYMSRLNMNNANWQRIEFLIQRVERLEQEKEAAYLAGRKDAFDEARKIINSIMNNRKDYYHKDIKGDLLYAISAAREGV